MIEQERHIKVSGIVVREPASARPAGVVADELLVRARRRWPNEHILIEIGGVAVAGYYKHPAK